jgi:hypothetical protein
MSFLSHALLLPPLLVLDLWYATRPSAADALRTVLVASLLAMIVFVAVATPAINAFMPAPEIAGGTLVSVVVVGTLMALFAGYSGARLGDWLNRFRYSS